MSTFWQAVRDKLKEDESVSVALVVDHSVHSPGTTGARMAVFRDGSTLGTIGGGIMEINVVRSATEALSAERTVPRIQRLVHRKDGEGEKSGLICAGFQTNLYVDLRADEHLNLLDELLSAERNERRAVLEVSSNGLHLVTLAEDSQLRQHDLAFSDDSWTYRESVTNLNRVAILGGGHCGLALSRQMHRLGYYVSIFDTRPRVPTMLDNDYTDEKHIVNDFVEAGAMIRLPSHTSVVVMTTELSSDVRALLGVADGAAYPFVGVMGSRAKIVAIRKALLAEGVSSEWIERLVAPVGLPIGSNTPDEIAVSVAAQLLQLRPEAGSSSPV